ncbi:hypothetical protein J2795_004631 [Chryseobacterium bernardetii]|uniref:Uncharacterized protein n=3 Tax=Chryseobacterium TaxID=59732 RepID=A0A543EFK0_9FLAO|nr:hypothetical protein [Chryseobacterium vietnamense]MDR6443878.1 hypothetical protein [Chryseobacterium bernardetii]MDR6461493.1 hypothetical protein [Chryseobacterium vietnamense]TQM20365.1 hypothetical protein FB551_0023 [Chryseobacterium aquifrigidense]
MMPTGGVNNPTCFFTNVSLNYKELISCSLQYNEIHFYLALYRIPVLPLIQYLFYNHEIFEKF